MGVEEGDRGRRVLGTGFELLDLRLETRNVLAHELGACLALAVVVLAGLALLCFRTLLTGGLGAVAFLRAR